MPARLTNLVARLQDPSGLSVQLFYLLYSSITTTPLLIRPDFGAPLLTGSTGFHCIKETDLVRFRSSNPHSCSFHQPALYFKKSFESNTHVAFTETLHSPSIKWPPRHAFALPRSDNTPHFRLIPILSSSFHRTRPNSLTTFI